MTAGTFVSGDGGFDAPETVKEGRGGVLALERASGRSVPGAVTGGRRLKRSARVHTMPSRIFVIAYSSGTYGHVVTTSGRDSMR